jgi:hypothetical protein
MSGWLIVLQSEIENRSQHDPHSVPTRFVFTVASKGWLAFLITPPVRSGSQKTLRWCAGRQVVNAYFVSVNGFFLSPHPRKRDTRRVDKDLSPTVGAIARAFTRSGWINPALQDAHLNAELYRAASDYLTYADSTKRPYVHLMDGGPSDNLGIRGPQSCEW